MNEIEKAIRELQNHRDSMYVIQISNNSCEIAISALEKQIPKKPFEIKERHNFRGDVILKIGNCPNCKNDIDSTYQFCKHCGQDLDWSAEE